MGEKEGRLIIFLKCRLSYKGKLPLLGIVSEVVAEGTVSEEWPGEGKEESKLCYCILSPGNVVIHNHADCTGLHIEYKGLFIIMLVWL